MGLTITATIAYGVAFDPEEDSLDWMEPFLAEDDEFDWERIICRHAGLEDLDYSDYPERPRFRPGQLWDEPAYREAIEAWRERVGAEDYFDRRREILAACPLDVDHAGTGESPVYILHLRGTRVEAYWHPTSIPEPLVVDDQDIVRARTLAAELSIPWSNPDWLLYPYYSH